MVELELGNIWTRIKSNGELSEELILEIKEKISYTIQEYSVFRKENVSFKYSLLNMNDKLEYPTGLYSYISEIFDKHDVDYDVIDNL